MHDPKAFNWTNVKKIIRYLKFTINHDLLLAKNSGFVLHAYLDANWVDCSDDRRFTEGFCIFLGNYLIS